MIERESEKYTQSRRWIFLFAIHYARNVHILVGNISMASSVMHVFSFHRLFTYKKCNKKTKKCLLLQNTVEKKKTSRSKKKRRKNKKEIAIVDVCASECVSGSAADAFS